MNLSGSPLDFFLAFFGGILVSFTPCVYPLLPITVAYIGASGTRSRLKGFSLSLVYVTGISTTYVALGLIAVLTGSVFGRLSTLPVVRLIVGLIIVLFGVGLWTDRGLSFIGIKSSVVRKPESYLSCFILGIVSGLVVSPCTAPILGSILVFVATKRNFIYGGLLLFCFAYGMGLLIILAGTFSSFLTRLPKSGHWMVIMKKICAVILVMVGVYFVFLGAVNLVDFSCPLKSGLGMTGIAYAQSEASVERSLGVELVDLKGNKTTLAELKGNKPVVLFFWTTWCFFCRSELKNLSGSSSLMKSEGIQLLAINIQEHEKTVKKYLSKNPTSLEVLLDKHGELASYYNLVGVPTFVFINEEDKVVFKGHYFPKAAYRRLLIKDEL